MTYVDSLIDWGWRLGPSCHLIADTIDELHSFADRLGMRRSWFQDDPKLRHYDLTAKRRAVAVRLGAVELDRREFVAKARDLRGVSLP